MHISAEIVCISCFTIFAMVLLFEISNIVLLPEHIDLILPYWVKFLGEETYSETRDSFSRSF